MSYILEGISEIRAGNTSLNHKQIHTTYSSNTDYFKISHNNNAIIINSDGFTFSNGTVLFPDNNLNYNQLVGFPKLPMLATDTAANTIVGGIINLVPGMSFYNTGLNKARLWNGTGWVNF